MHVENENSHKNVFTFRKRVFNHTLCYKVSFNLAIDKNSLGTQKHQLRTQQDTSSCGSFHLRSELVSSETLVYIGIEAKSREYKGMFKVKSRVKTWQALGIWSQQLEHKQVPKRGDRTMCPEE